jgi:transposase
MRRRFELSDEVWDRIAPQLPAERGRRARPARDNRSMVNAMLWILRTGAPWRDMPDHYPPWKSVYTRFSRWAAQGIWQRVLRHLTLDAETEGYLIDGTIVRAHQDAHGARKGGRRRSGVRAEVRPRRSTPLSMPSASPSALP